MLWTPPLNLYHLSCLQMHLKLHLKINQMTCHVKGIVWVFQLIILVLHLKQACSKTKKPGHQNTQTVYNYLRRDYITYLNYFPVMKLHELCRSFKKEVWPCWMTLHCSKSWARFNLFCEMTCVFRCCWSPMRWHAPCITRMPRHSRRLLSIKKKFNKHTEATCRASNSRQTE